MELLAIAVLEKARRDKESKNQKHSLIMFHNFIEDSDKK